jgi:hypothetical protein
MAWARGALIGAIRRGGGAFARGAAHFHRNERGAMLDYLLVMAAIVIPLFFAFGKLFEVLSDYFGMIAFYVTWPFL